MEDETVSVKIEVSEECVLTNTSIVDIKEEIKHALPDDDEPPTLSLPETENVQEFENLLEDISEIKSMLCNSDPVIAKNVEETWPVENTSSTDNVITDNTTTDMTDNTAGDILSDTITADIHVMIESTTAEAITETTIAADVMTDDTSVNVTDDTSVNVTDDTAADKMTVDSSADFINSTSADIISDNTTTTTTTVFDQNTSNVQLNIQDKETQTLEEYEVTDRVDHSLLQPPLNLGVKNVKQIITCIQSGSVEVQDIILNECNIIYECKVCHNFFRCLANLLSHKRFYCKDSYFKVYEQYKRMTEDDVTMVIEPETPPEFYNEESTDVPNTPDAQDTEPPVLKEIQLSTPKIFTPNSEKKRPFSRNPEDEESRDETFIHLEHIKSNPNAVFQTVIETSDKMEISVSVGSEKEDEANSAESNTVTATNKIIAGRAQKLMKRSDCDIKALSCLKCNLKFDTLKGLYLHMMTTHANKRIYYPCIYCKTSFASIYGVGRHMMKVHNKSKEHIARIRDLVKRRAFICKGPFPAVEVRENQEPRTEVVVPPKMYPCSRCNRVFDRKTSQISHEKYCRIGDSETTQPPLVVKKKEPEVRGPSIHRCGKCGRSFKLKSSQISHTKYCKGPTSNPPQNVKPKPPKIQKPQILKSIKIELPEESCRPKRDAKKKLIGNEFVSSQSLKWRSANKVESISGTKASTSSIKEETPVKKLPSFTKKPGPSQNLDRSPSQPKLMSPSMSPMQSLSQTKSMSPIKTSLEKASSQVKLSLNVQAKSPHSPKTPLVDVIEGRVSSIINAQKLTCLKCSRKFSTFSNLRRHAATHIGWMRFRCKHCSYKCFNRSDCRSHIQRMHPGTYTSTENIDRNIIKLATGKLKLRRGDLLPDSEKKAIKSKKPDHVQKSSVKTIKIKLSKPAKERSSQKAVATISSKLVKASPPLKVFEIKPPKPVTSVVLKTTPQEPVSPEVLAKTSPRKVQEVVKINPPKPVTSLVLRKIPPESVAPIHSIPTLFVKSSARKSTGGANPKILKRVLIPPPPKPTPSQPLPKATPSQPLPKPTPPSQTLPKPTPSSQTLPKLTPSQALPKPTPPPSPGPPPLSPQVTPQKQFSPPRRLDSPPCLNIQIKPKEGSPATTKPHVILLNARKSNATSVLVTRAGAYTKPILELKIPAKPSVNQRNGQMSPERSEPNPTCNNQLLDHQYT